MKNKFLTFYFLLNKTKIIIENNTNSFFVLFCFLLVFVWFFSKINYVTLIFLLPAIIISNKLKIKYYKIIIIFIISALISYGINNFNFPEKQSLFKIIFKNNLLNKFIIKENNYYYSDKLAKFINLLLFNDVDYKNDLYKNFQDLNLLYLIVVSGFHFAIIYKFIKFIFFKFKKINHNIAIIVLLIYWIALDFSYSGFRVLLTLILMKKNFKNWYSGWTIISFASLIFSPKIYTHYTFLLSSGSILIILMIKSWNLKLKIYEWFLINILISIYSSFLLIGFTKKIVYLMIINNFLMTPIIIGIYSYLFFTWFLFFLNNLHEFIYYRFLDLLNLLKINKFYLYIPNWNNDYSQISIFILIIIIFLFYFKKVVPNNY